MAENQVKVSKTDGIPNYLFPKIQAGNGISIVDNGSSIRIDAIGTAGDGRVAVDSLDMNPGYLLSKLTAGSNVTLTNLGASIEISSIDTGMLNPMTTLGDLIVGAASGTPDRLPIGSEGHVLTVSSGSPAWVAIPTQTGDHKVAVDSSDSSPDYLGNKISAGTNVSLTNTGSSIQVSATDTVWPDPMTTEGDIVYENSSLQPARLGIGTNGQVLTVDSGVPSWQTIPTQTGDHKVLVDSSDTNPQYLGLKLKSGAGINISYYNHDKMEVAALGQVKVALLGTMDYLGNKILQGSNITLTKTNNDITIAANVQTGDHKVAVDSNDTSPGYLASKLTAGSNVTITNNGTDLEISATDTGFANPMTGVGDLIVGGSSGSPTRLAKGYQGQILKVGSSSLEWAADVGFVNPMEERGDLIVGTYDGVASRLPIGTVNQFLFSNGTTAEWATLPMNIDWFVKPGLANGEFNQVIDRTFYVRMYPSLQMRAINHVAMILSGAIASDVIRVAVYDNARTMVAYGESTSSSSTFRRVTLTQLQPWTPGTNDLYYIGVSIHASSNASTKIKTASVTSPSYCWYEDVALTSGRAMPAPSSLTTSGSKVPIIGLRGR